MFPFSGLRSFQLFRFLGIPVKVHVTFLYLLGFLFLWNLLTGGITSAFFEIARVLLLFGSVILHEFANCVVAMALRIPIYQITLYPIGGVAQMGPLPAGGFVELVVAAAGPLFSLALAAVSLLVAQLTGLSAFHALWQLNLILGLFNLVPAFPLDGGRIYRSFLAARFGYLAATEKTCRLSQILAVVAGFAGLVLLQPVLVLLAIFVFFAATAERFYVRLQHLFPDIFRFLSEPTSFSAWQEPEARSFIVWTWFYDPPVRDR